DKRRNTVGATSTPTCSHCSSVNPSPSPPGPPGVLSPSPSPRPSPSPVPSRDPPSSPSHATASSAASATEPTVLTLAIFPRVSSATPFIRWPSYARCQGVEHANPAILSCFAHLGYKRSLAMEKSLSQIGRKKVNAAMPPKPCRKTRTQVDFVATDSRSVRHGRPPSDR